MSHAISHSQWETYQQTWQANALHLYHLPEENFESNELYGPVNFMFLIILECDEWLVNVLLLANLHTLSYGGRYKY